MKDSRRFGSLTPGDQRALHDYFQPSKDLPPEVRLAHRATVTAARPSLPHQAGRALSKLRNPPDALPVHRQSGGQIRAVTSGRGRQRNITVRAVLRPEIDYPKLARALLMLARDSEHGPEQFAPGYCRCGELLHP